jgi:hypothetical protein
MAKIHKPSYDRRKAELVAQQTRIQADQERAAGKLAKVVALLEALEIEHAAEVAAAAEIQP